MAKKVTWLTNYQLNPVVRGANYFSTQKIEFGPRYNFGYQIFYVFSGKGQASINSNDYTLKPGDFFLYGPGDCHMFKSSGSENLRLTTIYFSLKFESEKKLQMKNSSVKQLTKDFWEWADLKNNISDLPEIPFNIYIPSSWRSHIEPQLRMIGEIFYASGPNDQLHLKSLLLEILHQLQSVNRGDEPPANNKIERFKNFVEKHYQQHDIDRHFASEKTGVSESRLTAILRKHLNSNFTDYLTEYRLRKAKNLLLYSDLMIKEIANNVGFKDTSYFVYRFRKYYKCSPEKYRAP